MKGKPVQEMSFKELREFVQQVQREIEDRSSEQTFIPKAYFNHRRDGLLPEEIDYDMCHIFR